MPSSLLILLLAAAPAVLPPVPAAAQAAEAAFATITLSAGPVVPVRPVSFTDGWEERSGLGISVTTPFYLGEVTGTVILASWKRLDADLPAFTTRTFALAWLLPVLTRSRIPPLALGWRVGIVQMDFDDPAATWHDRVEHELVSGPVVRTRFDLSRRLNLRLELTHSTLFLSRPARGVGVAAFLGWRFDTPPRLREFLQ